MRDTVKAILRSDLPAFIQKVFSTVSPGDKFKHNWHIEAIAFELNQSLEGKTQRLLVTQPPRSLKSICISVAFVAWALGHDPELRFICVSYSETLSKELARQFRMVVEAGWYKKLFPRTRMKSATSLEWRTTAGGGRIATSTGGTLTGLGADVIIIDDPMKAEDAQSQSAREGVVNWYRSTLLSRLNDKQRGVIILIMQRLHEDDLAGHVLEENGWRHLDLAAIAEERQKIQTGPNKFHIRKVGDLLHPERESAEALKFMKGEMGSLAFSAQYQQRPVPLEGNLIKRSWFQDYDQPPTGPGIRIVQSWDIATTTSEKNDYSVCTTWAIDKKDYYLLHVWRGRLSYPDLRKKIIAHAKAHGVQTVLIEKAGPGLHLVQDLRQTPGISTPIAIQPKGDKVQRMEAQSARIEAGQVFLPHEAPWLGELLNELLAFPKGKHDDQVDSVSQFLTWITTRQHREVSILAAPQLIRTECADYDWGARNWSQDIY